MQEKTLGLVKAQEFTFAGSGQGFKLECGEGLSPVTLAYETYGYLNSDKTNAILIAHALSGDAHAAGLSDGGSRLGWWDNMIGPGKAFDTDKYFIICSNVLGGCRGSSGPSSANPKTKKPYGLSFPSVTIRDMVNAQKELIDYLGIDKLLSVAGGSMGGMQVLAWLVAYPGRLRSAIPIATSLKHSPQQIAFNEVGRQAIIADPCWRSGDYYGSTPPARGLSLARMIGHITYMSDQSMEKKFGRLKKKDPRPFKFTADFEVEGYLHYRGDNFVKRFDANSYLYITKAMDNFNLLEGGTIQSLFKGVKARLLVIAFKSDWLYPSYQSKEIVKAAKLAGLETTYCEVDSAYGHDAFLLETKEETHLIRHFLKKAFYGYGARVR
ncbi:MAG: homoserine O-acetyltransferase [Candidatus Omnitrophota bacterium]